MFTVANFKKGLIVACLMYGALPVFAQLNNNALSDEITLNTTDSQSIGLVLQNFNYLRNTEYFNNIEPGRTLFGTQIHPQLFYQPHPKIRLQGGVFLQSDFGETPVINKILPTFTLKINNRKNTGGFLFGTLEGALSHRLIEPLFDVNSAITNRIEYGAQYRVNGPQLFFDGWINWENYIAPGYNEKEQFTAGLNLTPTVNVGTNGWQYQPSFQLTAFHRGGQIDTDTTNMYMAFNSALGLTIQKQSKGPRLKYAGISGYITFYRENSNSKQYHAQNGEGFYVNAFAYYKKLGWMFSYWNGTNYIAPRGTALYQSAGAYNPLVVEENRQLLFGRLFYTHKIYNQVELDVRVEPVQDLVNAQLDFSFSVYLVYHLNKAYRLK